MRPTTAFSCADRSPTIEPECHSDKRAFPPSVGEDFSWHETDVNRNCRQVFGEVMRRVRRNATQQLYRGMCSVRAAGTLSVTTRVQDSRRSPRDASTLLLYAYGAPQVCTIRGRLAWARAKGETPEYTGGFQHRRDGKIGLLRLPRRAAPIMCEPGRACPGSERPGLFRKGVSGGCGATTMEIRAKADH